MALISTQPITDSFGNVYNNAYGVIDQCNGNKKDKQQLFVFEIYKSLLDRQIGIKPFKQDTIPVSGVEFDNWFSPQAIIANGGNQYLAAYNYLLQLRVDEILKYPDWRIADISEDVLIVYTPIITPDWDGLSKRCITPGDPLFALYTRFTLAAMGNTRIAVAQARIETAILTIRVEGALAGGISLLTSPFPLDGIVPYIFTQEEKDDWNLAVTALGFSPLVFIN